ncbi:uncharacterized protein LOC106068610 [Biomphalaria glabrata]|uniref:Uncharacterized protein LOC106068610 n=1 Tax=Biomphalaria glabrata TaxID=6526 RepID=A0A9U8EDY7_BIOGL|nr:uncharacterized protein LOC106068610 [Biomphalaria glabrata]XP_013083492.2 uncharacterized protein LOC106068610 [Biomphalaria glabrata]XP_013083493.2 uncharacterized protein LOC106068610 [Biomphalaria glabrata]XP_055860769.1 uncharacterized protein LOC106068610 [Biomphalaria glabrata]
MSSGISSTSTSAPSDDKNNAAVIAGSVVAAVVVIVILVVVLVFLLLKRQKRKRLEQKEIYAQRLQEYNNVSFVPDTPEFAGTHPEILIKRSVADSPKNYESPNNGTFASHPVTTLDTDNSKQTVQGQNVSPSAEPKRMVKLSSKRAGLQNGNLYAVVSIYSGTDHSNDITQTEHSHSSGNSLENKSPFSDSGSAYKDISNENSTTTQAKPIEGSQDTDNTKTNIYFELETIQDDLED